MLALKTDFLFNIRVIFSALLCKNCKEKQEKMSYVLFNWFMTVTDSERRETFEALIPPCWVLEIYHNEESGAKGH